MPIHSGLRIARRSESEAMDNIREAIEGSLEARKANGMPLTVSVHEIEVAV